MDSQAFLIQLVIILFSARLCGELAAKMQIPSVIGELFAGIAIGPSLFNLVEITPPIHLLAEIGIILLLFEVGLDTDVGRLLKAGFESSAVAIVGVVLPFIGGYVIGRYAFDFSFLASLFIGSTLTATSIGITLRVLKDIKKQSTHEAQVVLGAAVIDDIIGIVLLALLFEFATSGEADFWNAGRVLLFIALFFVCAPIAAKLITTVIRRWEEKSQIPGLLPALIVALILFFSWLAHVLGAPELLGGFAAGLALSRQFFIPFIKFLDLNKEFADKVHDQMLPIIHLFTPIFFVSIGLSLNFHEIAWTSSFIWSLSLALLSVAILAKLASGFVLFKKGLFTKLVVGIAMIPRGEVGLIFAGIALSTGVFDNEVYAAMILVIAVTTLLPPFALRAFYQKKVEHTK